MSQSESAMICRRAVMCGAIELQCISMSQAIFQQWPEFLMSLQREAEITHPAIGCTDADLLTRVTPALLCGLLFLQVVHAVSTHLDVQGRARVCQFVLHQSRIRPRRKALTI